MILKRIVKAYPSIQYKLKQARISYKPELFLKRCLLSSLYISATASILLFFVLGKSNSLIAFYSFLLIFIISMYYMLKLPDVIISRIEKDISREIVYAGRFLVIELESGMPLYDAFVNLARNYKTTGGYFKEITDKVNLGTGIEEAINDAIELTPSRNFRRILWQIINATSTGADVSKSLNTVIDQISREQKILLQEYGRKLNPIAMFYMIVAVIVPSLSITFLIILASLINLELNLTFLLFLSFLLAFVQFMFLAIIKFLRPAVDF